MPVKHFQKRVHGVPRDEFVYLSRHDTDQMCFSISTYRLVHSRIYLFYISKSSNRNESHWAALSSFPNVASFLAGCALDARSDDGAQRRAFNPCRWSTFKRGFTGSPGTCLCTGHVTTQPRCAFQFQHTDLCIAESIFFTLPNRYILMNHTRQHSLLFKMSLLF